MKLFIFISLFFTSYAIQAHDACELPLVGAKALARLYILDNEIEMNQWVHFQDIKQLSKEVIKNSSFVPPSEPGAGYYFDLVDQTSKSGDQQVQAWLYVTCQGHVFLQNQMID